jgi:acetylornithine deacetylase/succinyl-diaminopimelate desuccinylase-like protein
MPLPPPESVARAVRTSARVALWASLVVTAAAALLLNRWSRPIPPAGYARVPAEQAQWQGIDFLAYPEVKLLRDYVRIDTSHPEPDEVAGAEFLAAQLAAAGVEATIERFADRRANLWAFVEGEDPRALVLHGHLDVEPAVESEGWDFPPFSATVVGPWIYGRGMYDMKSLTVAQLLATVDAARAAREGRRPKRSLLFLQTSGEEDGSDTGTRWILGEHPELVGRMGTVLTEGGVVEATSPSDIKYWGIEFGQKTFARVVFCGRDRRSLEALRHRIESSGKGPLRPEIDPSVRRFLASYGATRGVPMLVELLAAPDRLVRERDRFERLTPFLQALLRDEAHPLGIVQGEDGELRFDAWLHLLPGGDVAAAAERLLGDSRRLGVAASPLREFGVGPASPVDHDDYRLVESTVAERFPGVAVGPYFLPWAMTDAHLFREAGLPAYGFSPFPVVVFDTVQIARENERMQLPAFRVGVELYRETVRRLLD